MLAPRNNLGEQLAKMGGAGHGGNTSGKSARKTASQMAFGANSTSKVSECVTWSWELRELIRFARPFIADIQIVQVRSRRNEPASGHHLVET